MSDPIQILEDFERKVETKVRAASTAAAVAGVVLSVLSTYAFKGAVPEWVQAPVDAAVTGGLAFVAGWLAKHTPRPGPPVPPVSD